MGVIDRILGFASPAASLRRAIRLSERGRGADAFPLLAHAAKAGIPEAEYRVARCYLEGSGVPPSRAEGTLWLKRAAAHGNVEGQVLLSVLYIQGWAVEVGADQVSSEASRLFASDVPSGPNFPSAENWAGKAAVAGSAEGQALLGYVLTSGPEIVRDLDEAHQWYERSAAAGCPQGHLGYALSLARRARDMKTWRKIAEHLRVAAAAGLGSAIYLLAVLTEQGRGVERDVVRAAELLQEAAEKGHRVAQVRWGLKLMAGNEVAEDAAAGESWLRRAAHAGDAEAAALVGDLYVRSGSLPPNYAEAAIWYRRAAEIGHGAAARALGSLYLLGAGVPQDEEEAARWLRLSTEAGDPASQVELANLEPIQEVRIQEQRVGLVNRRSMMRIIARRINAAADRA
jgi:TPR repeat protein